MTSAAGSPGLSTPSPQRLRPRSHLAYNHGHSDVARFQDEGNDALSPVPQSTQVPQSPQVPQPSEGDSVLDVSVIVPTYNEVTNIRLLLDRLGATLAGLNYQIVVVDDNSEDKTWRVAEQIAQADERILVIRRMNQRGLSSAVLAGMAEAGGRSLVVIDGDLQHDETKIPDLVAAVLEGGVDICLASREAVGGSYGSFRRRRKLVSYAGAAMARQLLGIPVSDPMSGFFAISRERFELLADDVNPRGFKILLEFLARGPKPTVDEVGYEFEERVNGSTKLNGSVGLSYLIALGHLMGQRLRRAFDRPAR